MSDDRRDPPTFYLHGIGMGTVTREVVIQDDVLRVPPESELRRLLDHHFGRTP